jgi:protein gp37
MRQAHRSSGAGGAYEGLTKMTRGGPVWTDKIRLVPEKLKEPLSWRKPRRIFVNSMSDLFHEGVPDSFIDYVFAVMAMCPQHTFQVLTKRPARMREYLQMVSDEKDMQRWINAAVDITDSPCAAHIEDRDWPLQNVWLGVSVEDQRRADERIPLLRETPAAVRWISAEPLLGELDITAYFGLITQSIDWVVAGGESGPGARPMHPDWARSLRDQCAAAGVPFFFKQWGEYRSVSIDEAVKHLAGTRIYNAHRFEQNGQWREASVFRLGKKAAGRELDGRTHDDYPS